MEGSIGRTAQYVNYEYDIPKQAVGIAVEPRDAALRGNFQ
jgi:hypothetical protein